MATWTAAGLLAPPCHGGGRCPRPCISCLSLHYGLSLRHHGSSSTLRHDSTGPESERVGRIVGFASPERPKPSSNSIPESGRVGTDRPMPLSLSLGMGADPWAGGGRTESPARYLSLVLASRLHTTAAMMSVGPRARMNRRSLSGYRRITA